jgi:peptide/nickel transport system permease protein
VRRLWSVVARAHARVLLVALALFVLVAFVGPLLWTKDPLAVDLLDALQPPSSEHPFGTDHLGRDVMARFLGGARLTLLLGVSAVVVSATIGTVLGAAIGLYGGAVDGIVGRFLDGILAFPALVMGICLAMALGAGAMPAVMAVAATGIPWYARVVRSEVLSLRAREFVDAQRALGASRPHVLGRHILPAVTGGVAVQASLGVAYSVLAIAALGFLGLGVQPPQPEWGSMITEGRTYLASGQWWISTIPGFGILAIVAISIAIGEKLRDYLDPYGKVHY